MDDQVVRFLIEYAAGRVLDQSLNVLFESSERTRIQQVVQRAIERTVHPLSESLGPDLAAHLDSVFNHLLTTDALSAIEMEAATGRPINLAAFRAALEEQGLDAATIGVPTDELLNRFVNAFLAELRQEARRAKSPLTNTFMVDRMELLLAWITGNVAVEDLRLAIPRVSEGLLSYQAAAHAISRPKIQTAFDEFLHSDARVLVVTGQSGTGKSVESAVAARRWSEAGWTVLATGAAGLSLTDIAQAVSARLPQPPGDASNWRRVIVHPWASLDPKEPGLIVYVDALDSPQSAERPAVIYELARLMREIDVIVGGRVRLIVSCETNAWVRIRPQLPFWQRSWGDQGKFASTLTVEGFSEEELDRALESIGAEEFRRVDRPRGHADPYVDAMRQILRHPAAFGLFAQLRIDQGPIEPTAATTSDLAEAFANLQIEAASVLCQKSAASISALLVKFAEIALARRSTEFTLSAETLREDSSLDSVDFDSVDPTSSLVAALAERGVIDLRHSATFATVLSFSFHDVGIHFLSLHLQDSALHLTDEKLRSKLDQWFEQAWTFPPLIDAIIAWANRLAKDGDQGQLITILRALIESDRLRTEVVARLLSPYAATAFVLAAKSAGPNKSYPYFVAVRSFRPAAVGLPPLRQALRDVEPNANRLAAIALGLAQDVDAVPDLARLLDHEDKQVHQSATIALGEIGAPAVPRLLERIADTALGVESRSRALNALRAVGYRTNEVATVLDQCLKEPLEEHPGFWSDLLFTAAQLRVTGLADQAEAALQSGIPSVARAGAVFLIGSPSASAESALLNALESWSVREDNSWVLERVGAALLQLPSARARAAFLGLVYGGLRTAKTPRPSDTVRLISRMPSTLGRSSLIAELIGSIRFGFSSPLFWDAVAFVRKAWKPHDLNDIAASAADVERDGTLLSHRVVSVLAHAMRNAGGTALAQPNFQIDVVQALVRCQVSGIAAQLVRLLPDASDSLLRHLLYILWILADPVAEAPLWKAFSSRTGTEPINDQLRLEIVRTLAPFATSASRLRLIEFTRTLTWSATGFDDDVLLPLVRHNVLSEEDLAEIAEDQLASTYGREACITSLAQLSPSRWATLIRNVLTRNPGVRLERECILALANMSDDATIPILRKRLQEITATWSPPDEAKNEVELRTNASVVAVAALGLAILGDSSVTPEIEQMVDSFPGDPFDLSLLAEALGRLKAPSSLPFLLRLSENRESRSVIDSAIKALGGYLPDAAAQETIVAALSSGSGGLADRGSQLAAMQTLAHYAPNLLLEIVTGLSPLGHLDSSARQWLAIHVHSIAAIDGVDFDAVTSLLTSLASDRDFWVREMVYQVADRVPSVIIERVTTALGAGPDAWQRACAIRLLGALEGDDMYIDEFRNSPDPILRDAAEAAATHRRARQSLSELIERFGSSDEKTRSAAFFALEKRADEWAVWRLSDRYPEGNPARFWFKDLATSIQARRKREHTKAGKAEDRTFTRRYPFDF